MTEQITISEAKQKFNEVLEKIQNARDQYARAKRDLKQAEEKVEWLVSQYPAAREFLGLEPLPTTKSGKPATPKSSMTDEQMEEILKGLERTFTQGKVKSAVHSYNGSIKQFVDWGLANKKFFNTEKGKKGMGTEFRKGSRVV